MAAPRASDRRAFADATNMAARRASVRRAFAGDFLMKPTNLSEGKVMNRELSDTKYDAEKILIEGYRRMSPTQKLKQVGDLTVTVQQFALARIRKFHGDSPEQEQRLRLASLWLDRETMIRIFNWDPEKEGY